MRRDERDFYDQVKQSIFSEIFFRPKTERDMFGRNRTSC
jgi:hypothetical protein